MMNALNDLELPRAYQARPLVDGAGREVIEPPPPFFLSVLIALGGAGFAAVGVAGILSPSSWQAGGLTPWLLLLFAAFGVWIFMTLLVPVLVAESWIVGDASVARRRRVRLFRVSWLTEFPTARAFEIAHGVWKTGQGSTDELVLLVDDLRIGIEKIENWPFAAYKAGTNWWMVGQPSNARASVERSGAEPRVMDDEIAPAVLGLGRYLSRWSGLPLTVTERVIAQPSRG